MTDAGREYAAALYTLAAEEERAGDYSEALTMLAGLLRENPDYIELLASPGISMDERRAAIDEAFGGDAVMDNLASFLKLLCERGHIREIFTIIDEYQALYKSASGVSTAYVSSAAPMSEEEAEALRKKLEQKLGHRVELKLSVDESLIGGVVVRVDGKIMDGSIKSRLSDIREMLR